MRAILRCIRPMEETAIMDGGVADDAGEKLKEGEREDDVGPSVQPAQCGAVGVSDVLSAVQAGDKVRLRELMEAGAQVNLNGPSSSGVTPLNAAVALKDDGAIVAMLLEAKAEVDDTSADEITSPLRLATTLNRSGAMQHLLAAGASAKDVGAWDLVSIAVASGSLEALRMLLQAGADPSLAGANGRPPVVEATIRNDATALRLLLEAGARPDQADGGGIHPSDHSIDNDSIDALKVLLEFKADVDSGGGTALLPTAVQRCVRLEVDEGLRVLKNRKPSADDGVAANRNNIASLQMLVEARADINRVTDTTAVLTAVEENSYAALEFLLAAGAAPGRVAPLPAPVLVATLRNRLSALRLLLDAKADANEVSNEWGTPVAHAIHADDDRAMRLLLKAGADANLLQQDVSTPVSKAVQNNLEVPLRLLLEHRGDPNQPLPSGATPVSIAIQRGNTGTLAMLLAAGGDPNRMGNDDATPVLQAAQQGGNGLLKLLLEHGGDVNHAKEDGTTLVFTASALDDSETLRALLEARGDVNRQRDGGATPAFAATNSGGVAALEMLLQARADAGHLADDGVSLVAVAAGGCHADALCLLIQYGGDPGLARAAQHAAPQVVQVQPAVEQEKKTPAPVVAEFTASISKGVQEYGLSIAIDEKESGIIYVDEVSSSGAVNSYNSNAEPDKQIAVGDRIVKVNNATGYAMVERLQNDNSVDITIMKSRELTATIPISGKLGLDIVYLDQRAYIIVKAIIDGSVKTYNEWATADKQIKAPSRIVAVNGYRGKATEMFHKMQAECTSLELTVSQPI